MQQRYPCPRCGVPVDYGSRFCSNCGYTLQASAPPPASQAPPPPSPQYPNQPQPWGPQPQPYQPQQQQPYNQQSGWNQSPPYNQVPGQGGQTPIPLQNVNAQRGPASPKKGFSRNLIYLVIVCVVVVTIGVVALATDGRFFSSGEPVSETPATTTPETPIETPETTTPEPEIPAPETPKYPAAQFTPITAAELIAAYTSDSNAAIEKYQGKEYAISGTISEANYSTPPYLYMKDSAAGALEIQFNFSQGQEANISALNVGEKVKVEGKIGTFRGTIIIVNTPKLVQ